MTQAPTPYARVSSRRWTPAWQVSWQHGRATAAPPRSMDSAMVRAVHGVDLLDAEARGPQMMSSSGRQALR
jgi:hypothetical protein